MDAESTKSSNAAAPQGGTIEPVKGRAAGSTSKSPTAAQRSLPFPKAGEHYELRDPFEEVVYRGTSMAQMVSRAEHLGATRFTAIDAQGGRSFVQKQEDGWQRAALSIAAQQRGEQARTNGVALPPEQQTEVVPAGAAKTSNRSRTPAMTIGQQEERAGRIAEIEVALNQRYLIQRPSVSIGPLQVGQTEYRFRGDNTRIAFTESTFRLATYTNSPSVARSMVDVAEARGWKALRISGNEDFKRLVWMESTIRGVKSVGYEAKPGDMELLRKEQAARQVNRLEPIKDEAPIHRDKPGGRGSGGRKALLAAMEAVMVSKGVPEARRQAVLAAATEQLAQRQRQGQSIQVKVYDKTTPARQQALPQPTRTPERQREPAAPAR